MPEPREDQLQYRLDTAIFQTNGIIEKDGVLSVPTVFTKEGVQNRAFKSKEQLKDSFRWLTNRPVVITHPEGWPLQHQKPSGFTSEPSFREEDGAVVGVTNFWVDRTPKCVLEGVKAGRIREGSVGYWCNNIPRPGSWKGQPYTHVEENIVFEHYAILLGQHGACPCSEGCGLMNSQSQPQGLTSLNQAQLGEKGGKNMDENKGNQPKTAEELEAELNALKAEQDKIVDERVRQFKVDFEAKKNELNAKEQELTKAKGERDALLNKLNAMVQAEKQRLEAAKNSLIAEIIAQTGESLDTYTGWDVAQLQKLNEVLKSGQVDRFAKTPRTFSPAAVETPAPTLGSPNDPRTAKQWEK